MREEFSWNALNQMLSADPFAAGQLRSAVSFEYDGFSRLATEDQDGLDVGFGYDASHNVTALDYPGAGPSLTSNYDALERLDTISDGGVFASYDYAAPTCRTSMNGVPIKP